MTHLDAANPLNWLAGALTTGGKNFNPVRKVVVTGQIFFIPKTALGHLNGTICV